MRAGSAQERWLRRDLAENPSHCILAIWRQPRLSSGIHRRADRVQPLWEAPNSEVRHAGTFGVLKLTLYPDRYAWEFVPVEGETFTDRGSERCR